MNAIRPLRIEKEEIGKLIFPNREVLSDKEAISARHRHLEKALILGNGYKGKVRIHFETNTGPREVYTTIWDLGRTHIGLKGGAYIPVHSIYGVHF